MTVIEYIKRKNELVGKETGVVLVPDDQIVEVPKNKLSMNERDQGACPYCLIYLTEDEDCDGCPMKIASNECCIDENNTYEQITDSLPFGNIVGEGNVEGMAELVEEFNLSNGFD